MEQIYKWLTAVLLLAGLALPALAQRTVSGRVTDQNRDPMPGVNVTVKGRASVGTVTDVDGKFKLSLPAEATSLVFSFVGMRTREVAVGNQTELDVVLQADSRELKEVVVTAFGIERNKQEVNYSVQEVKGEEVAETLRPNVVNGLQGRVAGVTVGLTGGTPGASSQIVIRGATSLDGNNQPLFVVDGVPVDNSTLREGFLVGEASNRSTDYTNRIADLNPNDIESITVLKGPAASALYGIDAAAGAIVITTKKGKKGPIRVEYSANAMFERITRFPETQRTFGFSSANLGTLTANTSTERAPNVVIGGWGPPIEASTPTYDNARAVFGWGASQTHNLNLSGGNKWVNFNVSGSAFLQNGSIPFTSNKRYTARAKLDFTISKKITAGVNAQYTNNFVKRPPVTKGAGSAYDLVLRWPVTRDMTDWQRSDGTVIPITPDVNGDGAGDDAFDNPFFNLERNTVTDRTNRLLLGSYINYKPTDWLNFTARFNYDHAHTFGQTIYDPLSFARYPNRNISRLVGGNMGEYDSWTRLFNAFFLATATKKFGEITATATVGVNPEMRNFRADSRYGENYRNRDSANFNFILPTRTEAITRGTRRNLVGVFGELKLDYKNMLYLSLTGRNDWSSTLPVENRSFFYPSVSAGFVLSEALGWDAAGPLSFAKIRASFAQVGKDAAPHQVLPALQPFIRTGGGVAVGFFGPNAGIMPETTVSYEAGFDLRFFNNRLGLDATYYYMQSRNQISQPRLSYASGYILQLVNAGVVENQGLEVLLTAAPVRKEAGFNWDVTFNFGLNRNKVLSLPGDFTEFYLSDTWLAGGARAGYVPGRPITTITGHSFARDANGNILVNRTGPQAGYPIRDTRYLEIGDRQPLFNLGITNSFRYKGFRLNVLWDIRRGGDVFNATNWALTNFGYSNRTLDRGQTITFPGVFADGTPNNIPITLGQTYYSTIQNPIFTAINPPGLIEEQYIERGINALRLRDVTLSYALPAAWLAKVKQIKSVELTATGNNLLLFTNYTGPDPDVNGLNASARGSGAQGFDYFSVPAPIAFAFGLRARF
ncbi:MAG: SusC/RagA family TonB-linked outer membrane protein [Bernardetiaceae bacterium]|nr:SusC/RagA family TonB-linked outer membrane protein [Bernardetiaceae bacterium]